MTRDPFAHEIDLPGKLDDVDPNVRAALQEEGFGILSEIHVDEALRTKLGVEHPRHVILGACNPRLAHDAMQLVPEVDALLPCNVTLTQRTEGEVRVRIARPSRVVRALGARGAELDKVMRDAEDRLARVATALRADVS